MVDEDRDDAQPSSDAPEGTGEEQGADESEDVELKYALEELEDVEARRKRIGLALGVGAVILIVAAVLLLINFRDAFVASDASLGGGGDQQENLEATDDPQCRKMIVDVTNIKNRFYSMESRIEKLLPGGGRDETIALLKDLDRIERRLEAAQELSYKAKLRFDQSEEDLRKWFDFMFNELAIVQDIAAEQLLAMGAGPDGAAGQADAGARGDVGVGGDAGGTDAGPDAGAQADAGGKPPLIRDRGKWMGEDRPPEKRLSPALVRLHAGFERFGIWHDDFKHPCGDNASDEEPWRPTGGAAPDAGTTSRSDTGTKPGTTDQQDGQ